MPTAPAPAPAPIESSRRRRGAYPLSGDATGIIEIDRAADPAAALIEHFAAVPTPVSGLSRSDRVRPGSRYPLARGQ